MASLMTGFLGGKILKNTVKSAADDGTLPLAGVAGMAAQNLLSTKKKKVSPLVAPVASVLNNGTGVSPLTTTLG